MTDAPPPPPPPASAPMPPPPPPATGSAPPELAGFWARVGAALLDSILYGLVMVPFLIAGIALIALGFDDCVSVDDEIICPPGEPDAGPIVLGSVVLGIGVVVVAFIYLRALARTGQTWGRSITGLRVVRADDGGVPGWGKAIGRTLFRQFVSGFLLGLGYWWMLWDDRNQTWHDKVAGTLVVTTSAPVAQQPPTPPPSQVVTGA